MGWFYITVEDTAEIYELSVTDNIKVSGDTKISSNKTEARTVVSDNAVAYNQVISYNGIISSIRSIGAKSGSLSTAEDYLEGLESVRKGKLFITCNLDDRLDPINNCLIEKLSFSKSESEGRSSWRVELTCKQIRTTEAAEETRIPAPVSKDTTSETEDGGNAPTQYRAPKATTIPVTLTG